MNGRRSASSQSDEIEVSSPLDRPESESIRTDQPSVSRSTKTDGATFARSVKSMSEAQNIGQEMVLYECYCEGTTDRCPHHDTRQLKYTKRELESMRTMG